MTVEVIEASNISKGLYYLVKEYHMETGRLLVDKDELVDLFDKIGKIIE